MTSRFAEQISEMSKAMLVAGLSLLVAAGVLLFTAERDLRRANADVQRTNAALLQLAEINSLVIGVDYSARGYALTGEKLFFDHEQEKQRALVFGIKRLDMLTAGAHKAEIANLKVLLARQAKVYADFVARGPLRTQEMAALIVNPVERKKRYDALDSLKRLHTAFLVDLTAHQRAAEKQQHYTLILTFVIVVTAFLGGLMDMVVKLVGSRKVRLGRIPVA